MAMPQHLPNRIDLQGESASGTAVTFDLAGWSCRVVRMGSDGTARNDARSVDSAARASAVKELANFELGDHRYALVAELPVRMEHDNFCADARQGDVDEVHSRLTNRELQIVQLICMGLLTKQVADRLRISEFTVRSYLKTIYCKLGVRSRGAMVYEYTQGLVRTRSSIPEQD